MLSFLEVVKAVVVVVVVAGAEVVVDVERSSRTSSTCSSGSIDSRSSKEVLLVEIAELAAEVVIDCTISSIIRHLSVGNLSSKQLYK